MMRCQRWSFAGPASSRPDVERRQRIGAKVATPSSVPFSRIHSKRADLSRPWQRMMRTEDSLLPGWRSSSCTVTALLLMPTMLAAISSPLLSSSTTCSPACKCSTSRNWCASSLGRVMVAPGCWTSSGATKKRCILFPHDQRDPVIDHHLLDERQASCQQGLFGFVFALLDDATGNQQSAGSHDLRQLGRNRANDARNDIRQHEVKLSLHTGRFSLVKHTRHDRDAIAQAIDSRVRCRALDGHAAVIDTVDAGCAQLRSR